MFLIALNCALRNSSNGKFYVFCAFPQLKHWEKNTLRCILGSKTSSKTCSLPTRILQFISRKSQVQKHLQHSYLRCESSVSCCSFLSHSLLTNRGGWWLRPPPRGWCLPLWWALTDVIYLSGSQPTQILCQDNFTRKYTNYFKIFSQLIKCEFCLISNHFANTLS